MSTRTMGIAVVIIGLLIIVVALSAGYIGLSKTTTIGTNKMILAAVGVVVAIVGAVLAARKSA